MKQQIDNTISFLKDQDIQGCITGSVLLDYFEGQDVDVFVYDEKQFFKLIFALYHNSKFELVDPIEKWKFIQVTNKNESLFKHMGLTTIKFKYNTCVDVNIIVKKNTMNIFSVLASFDMDIISIGYDIQTKQTLDLSNGSHLTKVASWNEWNTKYYIADLWNMSQIVRQLERCFKYYERGYNTDKVVTKYIEIIDKIQDYDNIFKSESYDERVNNIKHTTQTMKDLCEVWLNTHTITKEEREKLIIISKEL